MSNKWKKIVASVAPTLGTALGGPLAGVAVNALAKGLLGKEGATEADVAMAVESLTPEGLTKLRELDQQFQIEMRKLDVDLERIAAQDRESARQLGTKTSIAPQIVLSAIFVLGYFASLYVVFEGQAATPNVVLTTLIGTLTAGVVQILNYWFGSSHGSARKTEVLANGAGHR